MMLMVIMMIDYDDVLLIGINSFWVGLSMALEYPFVALEYCP